jgi:hypothetical protein
MNQHFIFRRVKESDSYSSSSEYMHTCSEDATWDGVLLHFAAFLDSCGYVGVYDKVEHMLEEIE